MTNNNYKDRPSWQIAKYQTDKKLLEMVSKLKPALVQDYAHIHDKHSLIGLTLLDYSNGKGDNTITVQYNLSPEQICYWFEKVRIGMKTFNFSQEKILAVSVDANGRSPVRKILITRNEERNGQKVRYPWYIAIENGTGIARKNENGSSMCTPGSYKVDKKAFINLNDLDMYTLLRRTVRFIEIFEITVGCPLIRQGVAK